MHPEVPSIADSTPTLAHLPIRSISNSFAAADRAKYPDFWTRVFSAPTSFEIFFEK